LQDQRDVESADVVWCLLYLLISLSVSSFVLIVLQLR
jgi:hypothetical protein